MFFVGIILNLIFDEAFLLPGEAGQGGMVVAGRSSEEDEGLLQLENSKTGISYFLKRLASESPSQVVV